MKAKTKLIATLMAMCLVITLGVFGILAVKTLNMSVGGNITFNADGVAFTIGNGAFYRTDKTTAYANITTQTGKMTGFSMNTNTKLEDVEDEIETWTGLQLSLDSQGDAVLKFNIQNDMTDKELYIMFTVSHGTNTNDNMEILCATSEKLAASANKDIYITFDVLDDSINAGLTGFKIDLNIGEPVQVNASTGVVEGSNQNNTKYSNAKYNLNTTAKTASVTRASDNISGEVVIMDKVYSGGQEYDVTTIPEKAFYYCGGITGTLIIPNSITEIDTDAFNGCSGLDGELKIGKNVTRIGTRAFMDCRLINGYLIIPDSVLTIEEEAFKNDHGFYGIVLGDSLISIGDNAFMSCFYMENFTMVLPDTLKTIGDGAFASALLIGEIIIPNSIVSIGESAFYAAKFTGNINIPQSLTQIESNVFYSSAFTGELVLHSGITKIGESAFGTSSFSSVKIFAENPPTISGSMFGTLCPIYVPVGSLELYETAQGWSTLPNSINPMN